MTSLSYDFRYSALATEQCFGLVAPHQIKQEESCELSSFLQDNEICLQTLIYDNQRNTKEEQTSAVLLDLTKLSEWLHYYYNIYLIDTKGQQSGRFASRLLHPFPMKWPQTKSDLGFPFALADKETFMSQKDWNV